MAVSVGGVGLKFEGRSIGRGEDCRLASSFLASVIISLLAASGAVVSLTSGKSSTGGSVASAGTVASWVTSSTIAGCSGGATGVGATRLA